LQIEAKEHALIRQYLLGRLPESGSAGLEERLLTDSEFYEELLISEEELIDAYLAGRLSAAERQDFENHFMISPERQEKVRFARALKRYVAAAATAAAAPELAPEMPPVSEKETASFAASASPANGMSTSPRAATYREKRSIFSFLVIRSPLLAYSLAAAVVVLAAITIVTVQNTTRHEATHFAAVTISPGGASRSGDQAHQEVRIPGDADGVRLQLKLAANQYHYYECTIQNAAGDTVISQTSLTPRLVDGQPAIIIEIATAQLPPGEYRAKVSGVQPGGNSESVDSYYFRVLK